ETLEVDRRHLIKVACAAAAAAALPTAIRAADANTTNPETLVKKLYDSLSETQRKEVAFAWDHQDDKLGLLRTRVSNNWQITKPEIRSDYYTKDQQEICRAIYEGLFQPDWVKQIDKQLQDDTDNRPWGSAQSVALFGKPGENKFELVMRSEEHTSELQSLAYLVCRLLLEKKNPSTRIACEVCPQMPAIFMQRFPSACSHSMAVSTASSSTG